MGLTKEQRKILKERISALIKNEPWLTNYTISQRFGCGTSYVGKIRRSLGLKSPRSEELSDKDFENSLVPKLLPKRRKKPHYLDFRSRKQ